MSDNAVAKRENIGMPTRIDSSQFGVSMGEEDLIMPRLVLIQPTSAREGAGKFFFSLTQETLPEFECVVFSNSRGRVMFDPDMSKQQTVCGSEDRIIPSARFENPKAKRCVECNFSNRNYSEKVIVGGKEVQQFCQETMTLKCMFVDSLFPFIFVGRRTSLLPINQWLTQMQYETMKHQKPLCCFPIKITSELVQKANQKYYVPKITSLGMIEKEEFMAMMNKYSNYDVNKTYEAEEKAGTIVNDGETVPF